MENTTHQHPDNTICAVTLTGGQANNLERSLRASNRLVREVHAEINVLGDSIGGEGHQFLANRLAHIIENHRDMARSLGIEL